MRTREFSIGYVVEGSRNLEEKRRNAVINLSLPAKSLTAAPLLPLVSRKLPISPLIFISFARFLHQFYAHKILTSGNFIQKYFIYLKPLN